ncbi:MAG: TIGR03032 family protein [Cyanobacteria bacterium J06635_15]
MNSPPSPHSSPNGLQPLRSVHTQNLTEILNQCGISLVVSTYQAGKLIVVRADGEGLNTHFRVFNQPMGVAADLEKLALGTAYQIWEFRNVPAVAEKLDPPGKHDGCYLPRDRHVTGNIDIHEMAYIGDELWFVNTRFSCLCTSDQKNSFVPRWRPPFISAYDLSDRCHLNGLGIRDHVPRYVTALGMTDTANGWRENKANGGILMDTTTHQILVQGLSMPHSPRWYRDQLWVLESGQGSLATVDLATGQLHTVVQLPGFTRGLDFWGPLAFVGLSQVRETAVFSGIPITERLQERICGVWVINIETAEAIAFLKFEDAVQEIFAVSVLPGIRFPELIEWDEALLGNSFVLPDEALAEVDFTCLQPTHKSSG